MPRNQLKSDFGLKKMTKISWISQIFENVSGPRPKSGTMDNIHELEYSTRGYIHILEVHICVYAWNLSGIANLGLTSIS